MHVVRQKQNHAHIDRVHVSFEARVPALMTIPIPMPSIPLLGPLLAPFIVGMHNDSPVTLPFAPTPTTTQAQGTTLTPVPTDTPASVPTPKPAPAPTTTPMPTPSVTDNDGKNSGDNGRSNDRIFSTSRFIDKNTSLPNIGGSTSVGHKISTGYLPHPTDAAGNVSTGVNKLANGTSGDGVPSSSLANDSSLHGSLASAAADVNPASGAKSSGSGSMIGGNTDTGAYEAATSSMQDFPDSTALLDPNGAANTGESGYNDVRHGLPRGAIAGMVIMTAFGLLTLIVVFLRGRYRQRRSERRDQWWNRSGTRLSAQSNFTAIASRSDRSFETTIDHAQTLRLNASFNDVPSLPPMAETRGSDSIQLFNQAMPDSPMLITFDNSQPPTPNDRTPSDSSESHYLVVPSSLNGHRETSSPVSVRPFSPSESFSFPMPPRFRSGDRGSSRPMNNATMYNAPRPSIGGTAVAPAFLSNSFANPSNPLSDPVYPTAEFAEVESIKRPFKGTRHDELTVTITDSVRVLRLFDDGWALVEKLPAFEDILANEGKNTRGTQGLIPIDCFRSAGQDLSTFFSEKRVSTALYQGQTNSTHVVMAK